MMWITWHFVHGQTNNMTVMMRFRLCREVCDTCIRQNFEPLGGFGKVVEIDESFLPGAPKYGRGRGQGTLGTAKSTGCLG